ncbi:hypothetical protein G3O08_15300 [Cryomorpha ignava]|uniref:Addiction module protein n=1 Tax=Cryomorpha ignava TaxID=101383 RepID=A0A7K3WTJ4_9FLAO|nr:hypothetical protein [Cryomorpha ignava]NEN24868.1 hypothetical protein [Cryomorpha ignava]
MKSRITERIMLLQDEDLLEVIETILNSDVTEERVHLNSYQIKMLEMSEKDIANGNLISESDLRKDDSKWMD